MRNKALTAANLCANGLHQMTPANIWIDGRTGYARCLWCLEQRRERSYAKTRKQSTHCRSGLHRRTPETWYRAGNETHARCHLCTRAAAKALYKRGSAKCVVGSCQNRTARNTDGPYICKKHRHNPPDSRSIWVAMEAA